MLRHLPAICLLIVLALVITGTYLATAKPFITDVNEFLTGIVISFIAVFSGIALAWVLIQKRDHQTAEIVREKADRVREGVEEELELLRRSALRSLTFFTQRVHKTPNAYDQWSQDNYAEGRRLLRVGIPMVSHQLPLESPLLTDKWEREERLWSPVLQHFVWLSDFCGQTIQLFGPALVEYRMLLKAMRAVQRDTEREVVSWQDWQGRNEKQWRWLATQIDDRGVLERPDHLLPTAAIENLQNLAVLTWSLIVAITHVLVDWDPMPPQKDMVLGSTIIGWPEIRWGQRSEPEVRDTLGDN